MGRQRDTVLVIGGAGEVREALRLMLEDEGYRVQTVPDSAAGLRILRGSPEPLTVLFEIVPLDTLTRTENGLDLLDAVVQGGSQLARHAYIMLSTALEHAMQMVGVLPSYLNVSVVREPFDVDYLLSTVEEASQSVSERATRVLAG
jgi:CheY-like chemotaxis protein